MIEDGGDDAAQIQGAYICSSYEASLFDFGSFAGKILGQIKALNSNGLACEIETYDKPTSFLGKAIRWLPFTPTLEKWPDPERISRYGFIYIRKPVITKSFIRYLKRLKRLNLALVIILEIPTYPYDAELTSPRKRVTLAKERHHRKRLHECVDRIAVFPGHDEVFDTPALSFINGMDIEGLEVRRPSASDDVMNVLSISGFQKWHGLDRVIQGLKDYYAANPDGRRVHLHLVGGGPLCEDIKKMVERYGLDDHVTFYGRMKQCDLGQVYDRCSFAIESLGLHRLGLPLGSTLKSREYLAKGMPFVYSTPVDVFEENPVDFCLKIDASDDLLCIEEMIRFYDGLYGREAEVDLISRIREYAENTIVMERAMSNVHSYIREHARASTV